MRSAGIVIALVALGLVGCNRAGISGAGSMRVEVEVYKGPLTQSPESQIGELSALLAETVKAMSGWQRQAKTLARVPELRCDQAKLAKSDCTILYQTIGGAEDVASAICQLTSVQNGNSGYVLEQHIYLSGGTTTEIDACQNWRTGAHVARLADPRIESEITTQAIISESGDYARRVSTVAAMMRVQAFRAADSNVGLVPKDLRVRNLVAGYAFLLSELSNLIATRTSILQKVIEKCAPTDKSDYQKVQVGASVKLVVDPEALSERRATDDCRYGNEKFPTSDFLRDVAPTRFLDAYDWFNASMSSQGTGAYKQEDRVRAIKALTNDYHWEKVNEVYASGQGEVSMAFVKDELGNWNLKSYTNDPSELLAAYRSGANALIATAVNVARKASGDPTQVARGAGLLDLAERFSTGKAPSASNLGGLNIAVLHDRTSSRLKALKTRFAERKSALTDDQKSAQAATDAAEKATDEASTALRAAEQQLTEDEAALNNCSSDCIAAAQKAAATRSNVSVKSLTATTAAQTLRTKQDELAVIKAQIKQLGGVAAEEGQRVLNEHQQDLLTLQLAATQSIENSQLAK